MFGAPVDGCVSDAALVGDGAVEGASCVRDWHTEHYGEMQEASHVKHCPLRISSAGYLEARMVRVCSLPKWLFTTRSKFELAEPL
jgi:hypothetical protein